MGKLEKKSQVVTSFDYEVLEAEQRIVIQQRTGEIKERLRHSAQDIWEIGQKLADVRSRLKHGQFDAWLKAEFGWSRRTAYNFINVYEAFGERANLAQIDIATSALYLLAAPSTPQEVRNEFLQRAKEGETVTHKELRQVIKEEKSQSEPTAEQPEPSQLSIPKPEIITVIPQAAVEVEKPIVQVSTSKLPSTSPCDIQPGWYLLEKQHLLFCGDTASAKFVKRTPYAALALAITSNDWDHDWLIERAKTAIVFPESEIKEQMLPQLIEMFSRPREVVIFPWLPASEMIAVAHKLERFVWAGDSNRERCRNAIAHSGLQFERIS